MCMMHLRPFVTVVFSFPGKVFGEFSNEFCIKAPVHSKEWKRQNVLFLAPCNAVIRKWHFFSPAEGLI